MKKNRSMIQLVVGLMLLIAGVYWLFQQVTVTSGFGMRMWGMDINGGLIVVPLIIGVVWVFINPKSIPAKFLIGAGMLIIIASIIANTRFYFKSTNLYTYLVMLVCICAGLGLTIRTLFGKPEEKESADEIIERLKREEKNNSNHSSVEEELNNLKK